MCIYCFLSQKGDGHMQNMTIQNLQPVKHEHTLNEVLRLAESLGINMLDFPDNMTKKRFRTQVEKKIVEHIPNLSLT